MARSDFSRQWDALADGVAVSLIEGLAAEHGGVVRRGWRWKTIRSFVVGNTRVTLRWRRRVV